YELESAVFQELVARAPRELPMDLIVPALPAMLILCLSILLLRFIHDLSPATTDVFVVIGLLYVGLCLPALLRLEWLWRVWRCRLSGKFMSHVHREVRIRGTKDIAL